MRVDVEMVGGEYEHHITASADGDRVLAHRPSLTNGPPWMARTKLLSLIHDHTPKFQAPIA